MSGSQLFVLVVEYKYQFAVVAALDVESLAHFPLVFFTHVARLVRRHGSLRLREAVLLLLLVTALQHENLWDGAHSSASQSATLSVERVRQSHSTALPLYWAEVQLSNCMRDAAATLPCRNLVQVT